MADTKIGIAAANAGLDALLATSGAGALLRIYSGSAPSNPDAAASGTLLAELAMTTPTAFLSASDQNPDSQAAADTISDETSALATDAAGYFRVVTSGGTTVVQGDVSVTGGGGDLQLTSTSITAGGVVSVTGLTVTLPQNDTT